MKAHFTQGDTQVMKKHMKKCSTSLVIRELQIRTIELKRKKEKTQWHGEQYGNWQGGGNGGSREGMGEKW